jgi:hypothetical protein
LMDQLIAEWKRQAGEMLYKHGYEVPKDWLEGAAKQSIAERD